MLVDRLLVGVDNGTTVSRKGTLDIGSCNARCEVENDDEGQEACRSLSVCSTAL